MYIDYALVCVIAYLLGNFSTSYIVSKRTAHIDIREHGSGNAGATNVLRVLGLKAAAVTFIGDSIKGAAAVMIGRHFLGDMGVLLAGVFVVLGHNWPIVLKFKGGKGIASTIGVILAVNPLIGLLSLAVGILVILIFRYVSLGSIIGICILPVSLLIFKQPGEMLMLSIILAILAVYRHAGNIQRLLNGTEAKIGQRSSLK
ncbi:MAG: glycerol-3-phosphate 1-O-acyltransferase PlsY [Bacillota bacterium]